MIVLVMTLSERNLIFKVGIAGCAGVAALTALLSFLIMPVYPSIEENLQRPSFLFQFIMGKFAAGDYYAVHASLVMAVLFALIGIIFIYYSFERTSAPEIVFISLFTVSFAFEIIRLILPLHLVYNFSSFYLLGAARILFFSRYFGLFSLFAASVSAAGLEVQKTRNIILTIVITALVISLSVPIDTYNLDTGLNMAIGYTFMFRVIEVVAFFATVLSFIVARKVKGSGDYIYVAIGVALALIGRNMLIGTDNWVGPIPGILLLSFGTWFICSKLHKIHLWL